MNEKKYSYILGMIKAVNHLTKDMRSGEKIYLQNNLSYFLLLI